MNKVFNVHDQDLFNKTKKLLQSIISDKESIFIYDDQWVKLNLYIPNNSININQQHYLSMYHLVFTADYLSKKVKCFSFEDIIKQTLINKNIPNSRANDIMKLFTTNTVTFNSYIKEPDYTNIYLKTTTSTLSTQAYQENFMSFKEFVHYLSNKFSDIFYTLMLSKVLCSSFFLSEISSIMNIHSEYPLLRNLFFNSFNDFKDFCKSLNIQHFLLNFEQKNDFLDAFITINQALNLNPLDDPLDHNIIFDYDQIFCHSAHINRFSDGKNLSFYYLENINTTRIEPVERIIELDGLHSELFSSNYEFYMYYHLQLKRKSINGLILQNIYNIFLRKAPMNLDFPLIKKNIALISFLTELYPHTSFNNNVVIYKEQSLFFLFKTYELNKIKKLARSKNIKSFFIADLSNFVISETKVRSVKAKTKVVIRY